MKYKMYKTNENICINDNNNWRNFNKLEVSKCIEEVNKINEPTPRVGVIIRCPLSASIFLKPVDSLKENDTSKYLYLTIYQAASNLWGFPKGRWKYNETFLEGALRELKEETGITLNVYNTSVEKLTIKRGKHHHHYFIVELPKPPFVQVDNNEITDHRWATLNWLSEQKVSYFTENVIENLKLKE